MTILNFIPKGYKPRPVQTDALTEVERVWNKSDVIILNIPVAGGKSLIAQTICAWTKDKGGAGIIVPNNILAEQYERDYPQTPMFKAKHMYRCTELPVLLNSFGDKLDNPLCTQVKAALGRQCDPKECCYLKDNRRLHSKWLRRFVMNYHKYMSERTVRLPTLLIDEAHNLIPFIQDLYSVKLYTDIYPCPQSTDRGVLRNWIQHFVEAQPMSGPLSTLWNELFGLYPKYLLSFDSEPDERIGYEGGTRYFLKLSPIDIKECPPILWPPAKVKKLVLLSATISFKDIQLLGLDGRRVHYIEADSCIPAEQRPIHVHNTIKVKHENLGQALPAIVEELKCIIGSRPDKRGIIHINYEHAKIARTLFGDWGKDRILWHDKNNKKSIYESFRERIEEPLVLMASGMYEGVDLPGDLGHFQVITKIPWPNLAEPAIRYRRELDDEGDEWYTWQAVKDLLQASGRICRGPTDYGETHILDSTFEYIWERYRDMLPHWYQDAVRSEEGQA